MCFVDDNFPLVYNKNKQLLISQWETKLWRIVKWLSDSGMKFKEQKTDLCLFYKEDTARITLNLNGKLIKSNKTINIQRVVFDSKMQWCYHIPLAVKKANIASMQ